MFYKKKDGCFCDLIRLIDKKKVRKILKNDDLQESRICEDRPA